MLINRERGDMSVEKRESINVAITGAAGNIAYSLMPKLLEGDVFGDKTVNFQLQELPDVMGRLEGTVMEMEDLASPYLGEVDLYDNPEEAFEGANFAFLVGAMGRKEGEPRSVLLEKNGPIFLKQGKALENADDDIRVLVVGNPANTNAMIASSAAPSIPKERFTAMTRLDHNRALARLAMTLGVSTDNLENMAVWGNHSDTMVVDLSNVTIDGKPLPLTLMRNQTWRQRYQETIAKRGGAVISARGASSAASAATAAADHARDWMNQTNKWYSAGVVTTGEYGLPEGIVYSMPLTTEKPGEFKVVEGLGIPDDVRAGMDASAEELLKEKAAFTELQAIIQQS